MIKSLLSTSVFVTVLLAPALAGAETEKVNFSFGTDRSAWYWKHQQEQTVGEDPSLPGGVVHQQRGPNPQSNDTIPVAVHNGDLEKVSTLLFDLTGRGVTAGSTISKMTITLAEGSDRNEQPSFNAGGKKVQACAVSEFWPGGQAELWGQKPKHDDGACAKGKRSEKGGDASWTFDLTTLAGSWGEDPSGYNGVALLPVIPEGGPNATWQLNLKIPNRDEYKQTKDRARMTLEFTPGADPLASTSGGLGTFTTPSSGLSSSSSFPSTSSSSLPASSGSTTPASGTQAPAQPVANTAAPEPPVPQVPGQVWLLIPLGLLALSAVRSILLQPMGGPRPDGVISAIRARNAERRGVSLDTPVDPFTKMAGAIRGGVRSAIAAPGRAWKSVTGLFGRKS